MINYHTCLLAGRALLLIFYLRYKGDNMRTKLTLGITRGFSIGITIYSPKLNGLSFEVRLTWFLLRFDGKGKKFIKLCNWWNG